MLSKGRQEASDAMCLNERKAGLLQQGVCLIFSEHKKQGGDFRRALLVHGEKAPQQTP